MPEKVISTPLRKLPRGANQLSSKGNLLTAWRGWEYLADEYGIKYHCAIHSPIWGWLGYRWDEKYGKPLRILPATQDAVWVNTDKMYLMRLNIGQNGMATITAKTAADHLFDVNESACLASRKKSIEYLYFGEDKANPSKITLVNTSQPTWGNFLADGAIVLFDYYRLIVLLSNGKKVHEESIACLHHCRPFVMRRDDGGCLYYTDDPRNGWSKSDVLKVHRERTAENRFTILFFTVLNDEYHIVVRDIECKVHLYRFASTTPERVEHVWQIADGSHVGLAQHNGFICITHIEPILGGGDTLVPSNNGFLVWDSIHNTFHTDIPRAMNIQKMTAGRIPTVSIPAVWGQDIRRG